jgi:hypothetical protein
MAYHYDPELALEDLDEKAILPNPVQMRDMLARTSLDESRLVELTRLFLDYQKHYAAAMELGKVYLRALVDEGTPKA